MKFPRSRRMTQSREFRSVRENGRSAAGKHLVVAVLEDAIDGPAQFGIVTSKRVGNAVARNRVRRKIRAVVREVGDGVREGYHVVTIARYRAASAGFSQLRGEWYWLARKLGVLADRPPPHHRGGRPGGSPSQQPHQDSP